MRQSWHVGAQPALPATRRNLLFCSRVRLCCAAACAGAGAGGRAACSRPAPVRRRLERVFWSAQGQGGGAARIVAMGAPAHWPVTGQESSPFVNYMPCVNLQRITTTRNPRDADGGRINDRPAESEIGSWLILASSLDGILLSAFWWERERFLLHSAHSEILVCFSFVVLV